MGNRTNQVAAQAGPTIATNFDTANNHINSVTAIGAYTYDAAGNVTSDGTYTYIYDAEGNMTGVAGIATYTYNALNQRVETVASGTTQQFLFHPGGQRAATLDGSGNALSNQAYWGTQPVAFYKGGALHYQHQDWIGTERIRTTAVGAVEGSFSALPFGDYTSSTGTDGDPSHYTGLDHDAETNTEHAAFRQYASLTGTWMRPDPYSGSYDSSNPQSFNRYAYVLNNPLAYTDPLGLGPCLVLAQDWTEGPNPSNGGHGDEGTDYSMICFADGGGGGGGAAAAPAPNNCANLPAGTPAQYCAALQQGLAAAQKALKKKGCSAFYGGQGAQTLDATGYRFLDLGSPTVGAETVAPDSVFVNSMGPYITYMPTPGQAGPFGRFWTQSQFRGFILLHELGHQLSPITGFGPDAGSPLNQTQSGWVLSHCF